VGTGNTRITLIGELVAIIVYCAFVYVALNKMHLPITIGWMSEWVYWLSLLAISWYYMTFGKWRLKKI
jgi:1,4-dihydroxy-2-naphthoate octaprenyltransferase